MSKTTASSTQQHLPLAGIQDGVVIMNDGSVRAILKIEPINFDLKSEAEQNGIIYSYQGFLNSLEFPIQIVIHSKRLDLERYLVKMSEQEKTMTNDLLRIQLEDYVDFVRRLISIANIMAKRFYVVIDFGAATKISPVASLGAIFGKQATGAIFEQEQFDRYRAEVFNRANLVGNGLTRLGLTVRILDTQQLIELFYSIYNPDLATEERLTDISNLSAGVVSGGVGLESDELVEATEEVEPVIATNPTTSAETPESDILLDTPLPAPAAPVAAVVPPVPPVDPVEPTAPVAPIEASAQPPVPGIPTTPPPQAQAEPVANLPQ